MRSAAKPPVRMALGAHIAVLLVVAVLTAAGVGGLFWWLLGRPSMRFTGEWTAGNSLDLAKLVLAVLGGIGAVVALVVAYRKQQLGEAAERRENTKLYNERFTKANE